MEQHTGETPEKLYVGTQNDWLYLIDEPPRPAPVDHINTNLKTDAIARILADGYVGKAVAARIMATYNACAGIDTETLEKGTAKAAKWFVQHTDTMNEIVQLGLARDEAITRADSAEALLGEYASQKLTDEMEQPFLGDYEGAYDIFVKKARAFLTKMDARHD